MQQGMSVSEVSFFRILQKTQDRAKILGFTLAAVSDIAFGLIELDGKQVKLTFETIREVESYLFGYANAVARVPPTPKDDRVEEMEREVNARDRRITKHKTVLAAAENEIGELKNHAAELKEDLSACHELISEGTLKSEGLENLLKSGSVEIKERDERIAALEKELDPPPPELVQIVPHTGKRKRNSTPEQE